MTSGSTPFLTGLSCLSFLFTYGHTTLVTHLTLFSIYCLVSVNGVWVCLQRVLLVCLLTHWTSNLISTPASNPERCDIIHSSVLVVWMYSASYPRCCHDFHPKGLPTYQLIASGPIRAMHRSASERCTFAHHFIYKRCSHCTGCNMNAWLASIWSSSRLMRYLNHVLPMHILFVILPIYNFSFSFCIFSSWLFKCRKKRKKTIKYYLFSWQLFPQKCHKSWTYSKKIYF